MSVERGSGRERTEREHDASSRYLRFGSGRA